MSEINFFGNIDECRTVAAIYDGVRNLIAVVYEDDRGWHTSLMPETRYSSFAIEGSIAGVRRDLSRNVNHRGLNPPVGLTRSGVALWLMLKDDGTAIGMPMGEFTDGRSV